ncbi:MAG: glycosyltransferase [Candidatus Pristimantibacillus sp.]
MLASEGLLITDVTPEVSRWFRPGKELLVTSSDKETRHLIVKYQRSPQKCEQIRQHAVRTAAKHSYMRRAAYVLEILRKKGII